jgi:hypothetical protein
LPVLSAYRRPKRTDIAGRWTYLYRAMDQHRQSSTYSLPGAAMPPWQLRSEWKAVSR